VLLRNGEQLRIRQCLFGTGSGGRRRGGGACASRCCAGF
jgi:hypothetical protein